MMNLSCVLQLRTTSVQPLSKRVRINHGKHKRDTIYDQERAKHAKDHEGNGNGRRI
jgi:hypothetical protein